MQNNPNNPPSKVSIQAPNPTRKRHIIDLSTTTPPNNNNEHDNALTKWARKTLEEAPATTTTSTSTTNVAQPHGQQH